MDKPELVEVPKIIHTIWAGGDIPMIEKNLKNIVEWAEKNPEHEIYLWVDNDTSRKYPLEGYKALFEKYGLEVYSENAPKNTEKRNKSPIIIKDIEKNKVCSEFARYEINRLKSNYGASSDLLRYIILYRYGGAYIDSDIKPGITPLMACRIFSEPLPNHVLFIDHLSQVLQPIQSELESFKLRFEESEMKRNRIGNDTFICTKGNPLMLEISKQAERNYLLHTIHQKLRAAYDAHNIKGVTIERTGPELIKQLLRESKQVSPDKCEMIIEGKVIEIMPVRSLRMSLTNPQENTHNWLGLPITRCNNLEQALERSIDAIKFEIKYFRILRLDDHIDEIVASTGKDRAFVEWKLKDKLKPLGIKSTDVDVVQLLHTHKNTEIFYNEKHLSDKTFQDFFAKELQSVINYATGSTLLYYLTMDAENEKFKTYKPSELLEIYNYINNGMQFLEELIKRFPKNGDVNIMFECQRALDLYAQIVPYYNQCLEEQTEPLPAINVEKLKLLLNVVSSITSKDDDFDQDVESPRIVNPTGAQHQSPKK